MITKITALCYDEQNRLLWASSAAALGPCGSNIAGSLTSAYYTASYGYDALGRLTSGPRGPYTYGDSSHLHAVTSIGTGGGGAPPPITGRGPTTGSAGPSGGERGPAPNPGGGFTAPPYTATYDAAGNMTCRSTSTTLSLSCFGTNNGGAQLSYDNEGRLTGWQNAPTSPTTTVVDAYDGEGHRVVQQVTSGGTTTTTDYLGAAGGLAEQVVGGALTSYYSVAGVVTAISVGSTLSYLASDGLGSVTAALSSASAVLSASQLFGPYGASRYSSGVMPTAKGFTGQYGDSATGLDYYNARYYDPVAGQFISADSVLAGDGMDVWGLSRFAYVEGNPETLTDPMGHRVCDGGEGCDGGNGGDDGGFGGGQGGGGGGGSSGFGGGSGSGSGGEGGDGFCNRAKCPLTAGGGARKKSYGGMPAESTWSWSDSKHNVMVYLRGPEYDPKYGWHYNLIVKYFNGNDVYNYHLHWNGLPPLDSGNCGCGGPPNLDNLYSWKAVENLHNPQRTEIYFPAGAKYGVPGEVSELASLAASELTVLISTNLTEVASARGVPAFIMATEMVNPKNDYWTSAQNEFYQAFVALYEIGYSPGPE